MTAASTITAPLQDEDQLVYGWRHNRFLDLGFTPQVAELLAILGHDWHYIHHLRVDLGYTPEQVQELVL